MRQPRRIGYTRIIMSATLRAGLFAVGCALLLVAPRAAVEAQVYVPASSFHPLVLAEVDLDYPGLLLRMPASLDLLSASPSRDRADRSAAYADFERALRLRTEGIVRGSAPRASGDVRREQTRQALDRLGGKLEGWPGAALFQRGRSVWRRVEEATDFEVQGYRVRLRMGEAVEGKLAVKVHKSL